MSDVIVPKGQPAPGDPEKKGWLFKWTNYLKGYQRRWFVLSNGLLSYYRNQAEMAHTCRGTISLLGALIHTADSCTFVISNGGTQTFHIRAHDEVERQSWVTALELAKAKAIRAQESDDDDDQMSDGQVAVGGGEGGETEDAGGIARELAARFHDLRTCSELVARHGTALQRSLVDLEVPPSDTTKQVSERATLFRISCNAMMNACSEFMSAAAASSARMSRALQHEREQKMRLQEIVEQLARQHDNLEKTVTARSTPHTGGNGSGQGNETEDEDHEFFDAVEEGVSTAMDDKTSFVIKVPVNRKNKVKSGESSDESEGETVTETQQPHVSEVSLSTVDGHPRRVRVPEKPNYPLSLWSIMKNCIGKDLSKIPIPVNFSEPLSMLQRLTEDYEYSSILDQAATFSDPAHQLAYVAAFTVSSFATTSNRCFTSKVVDIYLQWIEEMMYCKDINVTTTVHNIIVGKLWMDHHGDMDIVGEAGAAAGYVAHLKYHAYGYFSKDTQRKVTGVIKDPQGVPRYVLQGHWDSRVEVAPVTSASADNTVCKTGKFVLAWDRIPAPPDSEKYPRYVLQGHWDSRVEVAPVTSASADNTVCKTGKFVLAWDRIPAPPDSEKYMAAASGAPAPEPPKPVWFTRAAVPGQPHLRHVYTQRYWDCKARADWANCPDIF
ncbi:Oxysterol-binding protein 1 [Papilio machaon]|uniref:Oxysterol-binding protein 1 n=1 Tax=Papilio machaon TaxID=76193 RepID=A0A0N0PCU5_PAPMA|nr:Oxysterol-binding protein 1 [Papilio machaon]